MFTLVFMPLVGPQAKGGDRATRFDQQALAAGGSAKTQLWPPAAMTTPDLQRTRPPANPVPSIYRLDEEDSAGDRLSPNNVQHVETNPPAEAHFKELKV
jgi:hypothetical protein